MEVNSLLYILPALITAFAISYLSMPVIIRISNLKQLFSAPDGIRKLHHSMVPTLGGIGIFAAFIISFSIWGQAAELSSYPYFIAGLFLLFLIGVKDDIVILSPLKKLIVQILASVLLVVGGGMVLNHMGGLFGLGEIPWLVGVFLSVLILVAIVNAFNLIDGIDGLAGGVGIIGSSILGIWFWGAGYLPLALLSFSLSGALIGFLIFNMHPAKIFMGDTGAMATGFILGFLALEFLSINLVIGAEGWGMANAQVFAISILIIPIIDTLRVIFLRIQQNKNPMEADRNHIHHKLIDDLGMAPHFASFSLWLGNMIVIGVAFGLNHLNVNIHLILVLFFGFMILPVIRLTHFVIIKLVGSRTGTEKIYDL